MLMELVSKRPSKKGIPYVSSQRGLFETSASIYVPMWSCWHIFVWYRNIKKMKYKFYLFKGFLPFYYAHGKLHYLHITIFLKQMINSLSLKLTIWQSFMNLFQVTSMWANMPNIILTYDNICQLKFLVFCEQKSCNKMYCLRATK